MDERDSDHWQLQTAKNRFSEVVRRAQRERPQFVTQRGVEAVVVIGIEEYRRLTQTAEKKPSFASYLLSAPRGDDLEVERRQDVPRAVDLDS